MFKLRSYTLLFLAIVLLWMPAMGENKPPVLNLKRPPLHIDNTKIYSVPDELRGTKLVVKNSNLPSEIVQNDLIVETPVNTVTNQQPEPDDLKYALKTPVPGTSGLNNIMDYSDEGDVPDNNSKKAMTIGLLMILCSLGAGLIYLFMPKKKPESPVLEETVV